MHGGRGPGFQMRRHAYFTSIVLFVCRSCLMMLALLETELMPWLHKTCVGVGVATSRLSSHGTVTHPVEASAILSG